MAHDPIRAWAKRYNAELEERFSDRGLAAQRARLIFRYGARRRASKWRPAWALAPVLLAALLLGFVFTRGKATDLPESARLRGHVVESGTSIEARSAIERVELSGGSVVELSAHSEAHLATLSRGRVEWTVLDGSVGFDVVKREGTEWTIHAGAYSVRVVGTAFRVRYERATKSVSVDVTRGRVQVLGPGPDASVVVLGAGQRFASPPEREVEPVSERPRDDVAGAKAGTEESALVQQGPNGATQRVREDRVDARRIAPQGSWQALARDGKYAAALALVHRAGVEGTLRELSAPELILLGNAARFSHDGSTAERAYLAARAAGSGSSRSLAAYYLSRTASDERNNPAEAIRWLETFLAEDSQGELAPSARARLMGLLERSGDRRGAGRVARDYLRLHPNGPHVAFAESLAEGAAP